MSIVSEVNDGVKCVELTEVIKIDEGKVRQHVDEVVRKSVEETLNGLLDAEADELCVAKRYERSVERLDTRSANKVSGVSDSGRFAPRTRRIRSTTCPFKAHFHMPSSEGCFQHFLQRCTFRGVADEILDLVRLRIAGEDQPVQPIRGAGFAFSIFGHQINPRRLVFPYARAARRVLDVDATPRLLAEHRAEATKVVHLFRCMRCLQTVAGRLSRPAAEIRSNLADDSLSTIVHAVNELRHRGEFFIASDPREANAVGNAHLDLVGHDLTSCGTRRSPGYGLAYVAEDR